MRHILECLQSDRGDVLEDGECLLSDRGDVWGDGECQYTTPASPQLMLACCDRRILLTPDSASRRHGEHKACQYTQTAKMLTEIGSHLTFYLREEIREISSRLDCRDDIVSRWVLLRWGLDLWSYREKTVTTSCWFWEVMKYVTP